MAGARKKLARYRLGDVHKFILSELRRWPLCGRPGPPAATNLVADSQGRPRDRHRTVLLTDASMFTDYYEILEISPNATSETIERMFRHLALRYHPDNPSSGDRTRFDEVVEAHNTLKDPIKRVQYDIEHKNRLAAGLERSEEHTSELSHLG